jgi:uncharacterized protein
MRYIITGGSGVIGTRLSAELIADGHEVISLSRNPSNYQFPTGVQPVAWDARTADGWGHLVDGAFAVINLAGENIGGTGILPTPWTWSEERKQRIRESRLNAGRAVVAAVEAANEKPQVVYQISGIDYYTYGENLVTEESMPGNHFPADVVVDYWEPSTAAVETMGVRRIVGRTAPLLSRVTGSLPPSLLQFNLFIGGRLGSGKQWYTWIHEDDAVRAIRFLIETESAAGNYNVVAPNPVRNAEFTKILGKVMGRPTLLPVPEFALKTLLGDVSSLVLEGRLVSSKKLEDLGFKFHFPTIEGALRDLLGK